MKRPVYLGLSILDQSKTVMPEFWYDYLKPIYGEKAKLCYMDTENFITHVKIKDIAEDVETRFDTTNYEIDKPLSIEKKLVGSMKDELRGQIMKKFVWLRAKIYSYLKDNNDEGKRTKGTKICVITRKLKFQDYKNCLKAFQIINTVDYLEKKVINVLKKIKEFVEKNKLVLKTQQRFKSDRYNDFTEEINKIALGPNYDKRIQSIGSIETYAHGMSKDLLWEKDKIKRINIIKQYKNV